MNFDGAAFESIMIDPMRRRWWLLQKALEDRNLQEALQLAQSADVFLTANEEICGCATGGIHAQTLSNAELVTEKPVAGNKEAFVQPTDHAQSPQPSAIALLSDVVNASDNANVATTQRVEEDGIQVDVLPPIDRSIKFNRMEQEDLPTASISGNGNRLEPDANASLAVWATIDDVVRYLRQRDDVVVSAGKHKFLVNGRFQEDANTLVIRANRMRERQHQPPFYLAPQPT